VDASRSHGDRSRHAVIEVLDARDIEGKGVEVLFGHVHLHHVATIIPGLWLAVQRNLANNRALLEAST